MPRFRSRNNLRPIDRVKHVRDEQGGIIAGTQLNTTFIKAVDAPVLANTNEVVTGSTVNGFFITVEINGTSSGALANAYIIFWKNPGANISAPSANAVGSNDNKRYVFHQEMVMLQQVTNSNPRTLFKGVIAIPKGMRRMGPNDQITLSILSPGVNINYCLQAHYKEFR